MEDQSQVQKKEERKVVVTPEDAKNGFEFWSAFGVPVMPGLKEAFDAFMANPTLENQDHMKFMLCKAIDSTDHPTFRAKSFEKVREACGKIAYEEEFERDFKNVVATTEEQK